MDMEHIKYMKVYYTHCIPPTCFGLSRDHLKGRCITKNAYIEVLQKLMELTHKVFYNIAKNTGISSFMKIRALELELFNVGGQTYRRTDMKLIVAFRNSANALKKAVLYRSSAVRYLGSAIHCQGCPLVNVGR
jgi:hypothetical protein